VEFLPECGQKWLQRRRDDEQATPQEPRVRLQGEAGLGCDQGRKGAGPNWWKAQLLEGMAGVFRSEVRPESAAPAVDLKSLHAKIGELTLGNDFLEGAFRKADMLSAKQ
jgi:hypothetical protein